VREYTGWSKNGIRIPVEKWQDFKEILDNVDIADRADKSDNVNKVETVKKVDSAQR
jgi:hypothetical protein